MRLRSFSSCLAAAALVLVPATASAQRSATSRAVLHDGARAVDLLTPRGKGIPVSALVEVPIGLDPRVFELRPIVGGVASFVGDSASLAGFVGAHPDWPIEIVPPLRAKLDVAVPFIAAEPSRLARIEGHPLDGRGVYVGVVDTGIDIFHHDFRDAVGKTRIAWLLDLSCAPRTGNALDQQYGGCVYARDALDAMIAAGPSPSSPKDVDGHGTHVTGIAAGSGSAGQKYFGVAPGADLVIVRASRDAGGSLQEADATLGVKFVFDRADADGRPAVVNLSIGSQFGPHDGTTTFERSISALAQGPGHAVVVAASNEGGDAIHTSVRVSKSTRVEIPIMLLGSDGKGAAYADAQVYVWLNWRDDGDLKVGFDGPDEGENETLVWLDPVARGDAFQANGQHAPGTVVEIANDVNGEDLVPRGTHGAIVTFQGPLRAGRYSLVLEGRGTVEAWVEGTGDAGGGNAGPYFPEGGQIEGTIGVPASDASLISIGCVDVREVFAPSLTRKIDLVTTFGAAKGTRCFFSSSGPSALGAMRPDVLAPGFFVVSALSGDASQSGEFGPDDIVDGEFAALSGTSMSSPFGAGAVALLFQHDPTLTLEDVRAALQAGARPLADDDGTGFRDYAKGAGILDVEGALNALERKSAPPAATSIQLRLGGSYLAIDGGLPLAGLVLARDDVGRPADVVGGLELALDGADVSSPIDHPAVGLYRFAVKAHPGVEREVATIRIVGALSTQRDVPVGADRWDAIYGDSVGGGCAFAPSGRPSIASLALAGALVALTRARRSRPRTRA